MTYNFLSIVALQGIAAHRRSLRPERRTRPTANPLKAMKNRANIVSEYTEERIELPEVETKKSKAEGKVWTPFSPRGKNWCNVSTFG